MSYRQKLRFSQAFLTLLLRPFPQGLHVFTLDFGHTRLVMPKDKASISPENLSPINISFV